MSGRTCVLAARPNRRGILLAETKVDMGISRRLDLYLSVLPISLGLLELIPAFNPRLLLLLPSATLILLLLHIHERAHPLPSLLGVKTPPASATARTSVSPLGALGGVTASTGPEGEVPVVPPKEAESGVDYYMNLQAIQNLMGLM